MRDCSLITKDAKGNWSEWEEGDISKEEKSLRHVAIVAKFPDDTVKPKTALNSTFALFQSSSLLFNFI